MLNNRSLDDRTYIEMMTEALARIPLYSQEWTNYNPSDPGITILENLTAFEHLQQNRIDQITPQVRQNLLKLAGFEAKRGRCARVLLAAEKLREPLKLPINQKFRLGELCFETPRAVELNPCNLKKIYGYRDGRVHDCSVLLNWEVKVPAYIFGKNPKTGDSIWFVSDSLPKAGEEVIFYVAVADRYNRNPFVEKGNNTFAALKWECYTESGFVEMNVKDDTGCFLVSGEIRMRIPADHPAPCPEEPDGCYVIRATLQRADYDVKPKILGIDGFLFEAWQKDTRAICHTFNRTTSASLVSDLLGDGYVMIFAKEEKGSSYRRYMPGYGDGVSGRFYDEIIEADGTHTWVFDKKKYGYGPGKIKNAIKVAVYSEEMMRRYFLGTVLGYDRQEIRLPAEHIVADSFCIIARRVDRNSEELFDFVRPSRYGEDDLTYYLYENEGKIVIEDAGAFIGAELYIGTLCVTQGCAGNIRAGNYFESSGIGSNVRFYNPQPGTGGCFRETLDEVKFRFLEDLRTHYTAVTAKDYEQLAMKTPELCIHKVKAFLNESRNLVRIAVKPGTDEEFPKLSDTYKKALLKQLEDKRLLTTKIEIIPPIYTAIDVHGTIYVKNQYENTMEQIEQAIRKKIDYIHSDRNFGVPLKFDEVFHAIEELDCVDFIYELSMYPQEPALAKLVDSDIIPGENVLCYAGEISLEIG